MVFLDEKIMMIDGKMNQLDRIGTILAKLMLFQVDEVYYFESRHNICSYGTFLCLATDMNDARVARVHLSHCEFKPMIQVPVKGYDP